MSRRVEQALRVRSHLLEFLDGIDDVLEHEPTAEAGKELSAVSARLHTLYLRVDAVVEGFRALPIREEPTEAAS